MNTIYTTTITDAARRRGIAVEVLDAATPIFVLRHGDRSVRCYNALTDRVGAVSFELAQDKHLANQLLARYGFPVPRQIRYGKWADAAAFLAELGSVVVKPAREWGGRGVSVALRTPAELRRALARARKFGEHVLLEECVDGVDHRVIVVGGQFAAAIRRDPATVTGNGRDTLRDLIRKRNARRRRHDPSHRIPLDEETRRALQAAGLDFASVPRRGQVVRVRRTSNYHTGGTCTDITGQVDDTLVREAQRIARLFEVPVLGVDFLVQPRTGRRWIIELSPDLAISPPEGERVVRHFLDYLFPETRAPG